MYLYYDILLLVRSGESDTSSFHDRCCRFESGPPAKAVVQLVRTLKLAHLLSDFLRMLRETGVGPLSPWLYIHVCKKYLPEEMHLMPVGTGRTGI